jgi:mono/diheme cytochrome c family protein
MMSRGKTVSSDRTRLLRLVGVVLLSLLALMGCRRQQMMAHQPQYDPLEKSSAFADANSSRPVVEGTVAQGALDPTDVLLTGKVGDAFIDDFPLPLTPELMARGRERYNIYCSPCHGLAGYGDGMIVARGYRKPPSFHTDQLRSRSNGHLFDVITNGFGAMPAYRAQVRAEDRWAIVAYERALQVSQNASLADVPEADRATLDADPAAAAERTEGEAH